MVRTLEGKQVHQALMEKAAEHLRSKGYDVVFQAKINNGRIDVLGFQKDEKVGIECQVMPNWKILTIKTKRYKSSLDRFIVAIPSYVRLRLKPENVEVIKFDVPQMIEKVTIRIEQELLNMAREKFPELKEVSDTDVVRIALRKFLGTER